MKSKIGIWFSAIYALLAVFMLWQESICESWGCGYAIGLATLPWSLFGGRSIVVSILYIFLNLILFYLIGLGLTKLFSRSQ